MIRLVIMGSLDRINMNTISFLTYISHILRIQDTRTDECESEVLTYAATHISKCITSGYGNSVYVS